MTTVTTMSPELAATVRKIVKLADPLKVILFGSAARGEDRPDSDWDFLVVEPEGTRCLKVAQKLHCEVPRFERPLDILVTTPAHWRRYENSVGHIYRSVKHEGVTLYERPVPATGKPILRGAH